MILGLDPGTVPSWLTLAALVYAARSAKAAVTNAQVALAREQRDAEANRADAEGVRLKVSGPEPDSPVLGQEHLPRVELRVRVINYSPAPIRIDSLTYLQEDSEMLITGSQVLEPLCTHRARHDPLARDPLGEFVLHFTTAPNTADERTWTLLQDGSLLRRRPAIPPPSVDRRPSRWQLRQRAG